MPQLLADEQPAHPLRHTAVCRSRGQRLSCRTGEGGGRGCVTVRQARAREVFFGWWIVGATFLIYFVGGGLFNTATVYFKALTDEFGWGRGEVSGVFSLGFLVAGASAPLWGRIADRRGARAAFVPGVLVTGALCFFLSRVSSLASLYLFYLIFSFGSAGISLVPVSVVISKWFVRRRGRAIGIAYTGVGFGSLALTPLVGLFVANLGWRQAYVASGLLVLVTLVPVALWVKNRPEDVGLLPDGVSPGEEKAGAPVGDDPVAARAFSLREAVRTRPFWLVALTWPVSLMPLSAVNLHQVPFLTDAGLSTQTAALVAGAVGGMSILGRVGFGLLSERYPIRIVYSACYLTMGAGIAALWGSPQSGSLGLALYVALFGIAVGGAFALAALLVGDLFGVAALGEIFGLLGLSATIGGAAGGVGAGLLFDRTGSYDTVFIASMALSVLGAAIMLFVRRPSPPQPSATGGDALEPPASRRSPADGKLG